MAGDRAGDNYQSTIDRPAANDYTPLERVLDCCDWAVDAPRQVVSGRNFSLVFDKWGAKELEERVVGAGRHVQAKKVSQPRTVKTQDGNLSWRHDRKGQLAFV